MLSFVLILLSFLFVLNALELKGNWALALGTWEITDEAWASHAPMLPADDTSIGRGTTITFLDSTHVKEVAKTLECTLDSSKSYSKAFKPVDILTQYMNGDYTPPTESPVVDAVWWEDVDLEGLESGPSYHSERDII
jgi:hypothetical protein